MKLKRKISVVTSTRADYSILKLLLQRLSTNPQLEFSLIITGTHLSKKHGFTIDEIRKDGFSCEHQLEIYSGDDSPIGVAKTMASAIELSASKMQQLEPDLLVVLGDRFEILAVAQAAMILNVPIAHLHGGEATQGLVDDAVRYALTKLSHLHFTSTEEYRNRVIQMGEIPSRVFNVGAPALELMEKIEHLSYNELVGLYGEDFLKNFALVTYHPVTLQPKETKSLVTTFFKALSRIEDLNYIVTLPNMDTHNDIINAAIDDFTRQSRSKVVVTASLGAKKYFSLMKHAKLVIGNSSSGIIEAPYFKTPTVNVGIRQLGRLMPPSVLSVQDNEDEIVDGIEIARSEKFHRQIEKIVTPYYRPDSSAVIESVLQNFNLEGITIKKFVDQEFKR